MDKIKEKLYNIDLHIHSTRSRMRKSGDKNRIKSISDEEFINSLSLIDAEVISITDHNYFDEELYNKVRELEDKIVFPGIEIDFNLSDDKERFHSLVIFNPDRVKEMVKLTKDVKFKNNGNKPINEIDETDSINFLEFIHYIQNIKDDIIIIPHYGKEPDINKTVDSMMVSRDINYRQLNWLARWNFDALEMSKSKVSEFTKTFIDRNINISIVNFSDNHEISSYSKHTPMKILFDGTFRDLKFAFSDPLQRLFHSNLKDRNIIESFKIGEQDVKLSKYLNTIIGPRGTGKSLLLEFILKSLEEQDIDEKYKDFRNNSFSINAPTIDKKSSFFLEQGQLSSDKLLTNDGLKNSLKSLGIKNRKENANNDDLRKKLDEIENKLSFISTLKRKDVNFKWSINEFIEKVQNPNESKSFSKNAEFYESLTTIENTIENDIKKIEDFTKVNVNWELLRDLKWLKLDIDFDSKKKELDNLNSYLKESLEKLSNTLTWVSKMKVFFSINEDNDSWNLERNKAFKNFKEDFKIKLTLNKMLKISKEAEDFLENEKDKLKNEYEEQFNPINSEALFELNYIELFDENIINYETIAKNKKGKLSEEIERLKTKPNLTNNRNISEDDIVISNIKLYKDVTKIMTIINDKALDINKISPGQKSKAVIKYILWKLTTKYTTIILDQPEDNLDPGTINEILISSIREEKWKRQFIIVTHSPLLVINADSNMTICPTIKEGNQLTIEAYGSPFKEEVKTIFLETLEGSEESLQHRMERNKLSYNEEKGYKSKEYENKIWE